MSTEPKSQDEHLDNPVHWTAQLPWLLAFLMIILGGLLKMDVKSFSQPKAAEENIHEMKATKIDLNTASQEKLEALPHIGPVFARRIIAARPFGTVEDLARVQGIGPSLIKRLAPWITVAR